MLLLMTFPFVEFTLVEGFLVGFPTEILRFLLSFLFSESIAICRSRCTCLDAADRVETNLGGSIDRIVLYDHR